MNASLALLRQVIPTVVHLKATIPEAHPSTAILGAERMGTATVVDAGGLALTAHYVVLGASRVEATTFDGRTTTVEIVAKDFGTGIAVLKLGGGEHVAAPLRSSKDLSLGEDVFLFGSVGPQSPRVSSGAVSALGPFEAYWEYLLDRAIQVTVANPGLGGGPAFDRCGRMVGIVSLNLGEVGKLALAIPVENYADHRDELLRHGRPVNRPSRAWVGLYCYSVQGHVVVAGLMPGGPGEAAGLKPGDVVLAIDEVRISDRRQLYQQLWTHRSGERILFRVFRDDAARVIEVSTTNVEEMFA